MLNIEDVDWNNFKLAKSGRNVKLLYNKEALQFCTASLYSPFGVKSAIKEWSNFTEYTLDCSLNQSNEENTSTFKEFVDKLDKKIEELVKENLDLFANPKTNVDKNFGYSPILKENGNYPKLLKLQLVRDKNGNFLSFVFDNDKNKIKLTEKNIEELLCKGKVFKCIIECSKVWYFNGKVGTIWNIVQLKFNEKKVIENTGGNIYQNLMILD